MDDKLKLLYEEAYYYLDNLVYNSALKKELDYYRSDYKKKNMNEIFKRMLITLKNTGRLDKVIGNIE